MGREEAVHHVHPGRQTELGHAPQDQRLVGRLLGVFPEDDDPAGVERAVDVVVPAVDVQRVLGERACGHLQNHRRALARRVVILLDAVDDPLARGVIHHALPADGVRDCAALSGVLSFRLDGDRVTAKDVELALGKRLLVKLTAFSRGCDWIEHTRVGNTRFRMVRNQLVPVRRDADSRKWRPTLHDTSSMPLVDSTRSEVRRRRACVAGSRWARGRPKAPTTGFASSAKSP